MQHEYNEANARALMKLMGSRVDSLGVLIEGPRINGELRPSTLAKMLASGGFPETESKALIEAFAALEDAYSDMCMSLCMPFDMARDEAQAARDRALKLGVSHL